MEEKKKLQNIMPLDISISEHHKIKDTITNTINLRLSNLGKEKFNAYELIDAIMSVLNDLGFDILLVAEVYYDDANIADEELIIFNVPDVDLGDAGTDKPKSKIPENFDVDGLDDAINDLLNITDLDSTNYTTPLMDSPFQYAYKIALKGIFYDRISSILGLN